MNELIKLLAVYEGKRSETSIGNLRETIKVLTSLLAVDAFFHGDDGLSVGFELDVNKKLKKLSARKTQPEDFNAAMSFLLGNKKKTKK